MSAPLSDTELRRSVYLATALTLILPPIFGAILMGMLGFYPLPEIFLTFPHFGGLFVLVCCTAGAWVAPLAYRYIVSLTTMDQPTARAMAKKTFAKLPWALLLMITLYITGGALSANLALTSLGIRTFTIEEHLYTLFGIVPVVLITVFPIFFFVVDRLGRYLAPRGIQVVAIPVWVKILMLGIITPLLVDSTLIGYFYNRTGFFHIDTLVVWALLMLLAGGSAWLTWRSLRQGLSPLEIFITKQGETFDPAMSPTAYSLDELGELTTRFAEVLNAYRGAESVTRDQKALLSTIINSTPDWIFAKDMQHRIIFANPAFARSQNLEPNDMLGHPDTDFWPHELCVGNPDSGIRGFHDDDRNAFNGITVHNPRDIATFADGTVHIFDTVKTPLRDGDGKIIGVYAYARDVSERNSVESENIRTNQLLAAIFDSMPTPIAHLDTNMNFQRVNNAYAATDEKTPEYFIGKNHFALFPNAENEAIFHDVVRTGKPFIATAKPFEYEYNPERGVSHWDWSLIPIKSDADIVTGLVLTLVNVTDHICTLEESERKSRELALLNETLEARVVERTHALRDAYALNQQILASSRYGMGVYASGGECIFINDAMVEIFGMTLEYWKTQNFLQQQFWHDSGFRDLALDTLKNNITRQSEIPFEKTNGVRIWLSVTFTPFLLGGQQHLLLIVNNISDRKAAEDDLRRAKEAAEKANNAKTEFLSRMSHELRTPMNAILGFAQILEKEQITPQQADFVHEIHAAGDHLLDLINELLDLARIESGKLHVKIQSAALLPILNSAIHLIQPSAKSREISIRNLCFDDTWITSDPARLRQILLNLLSNAVKYNKQGGYVTITCTRLNETKIRVLISDTGSGIAPEKMEKLFTPFERLGAEFTAVDGTGIGLALSRRIAEIIGAELGVTSKLGEGSIFFIDLPLSNEQSDFLSASPAAQNSNSGKYKVLCIEDNPANLRVIEAAFRDQDELSFFSAANGEQGLELARRYQPDVILVDIHLPGMDGYAVLRALNLDAKTRRIPTIALSAEAMPIDIERGLAAGFTYYLIKPLDLDELRETVSSVLNANSV